MPQQSFISASLWVFFVPLVIMLLGALIGQQMVTSEAYIALFGLGGFILGLLAMHWRVATMQKTSDWQPSIVKPKI